MVTENIKPFSKELNVELRNMYLKSLQHPVSYDNGATVRPRVRHYKLWEEIPKAGNIVDIIAEGKKIWVWSDLHFGHNNIIRFSDRPFPDVDTMNEMLIKNFNDVVSKDDISIWVGDVSFKGTEESKKIVRRCNGYKILVVGNHDFEKKKGLRPLAMDEVHIVYNLEMAGTKVAFTHYPMDNLPIDWVNVHGHVHVNGHHKDEVLSTTHINVNCEFWDYKPIPLETIYNQVEIFKELNATGKRKGSKIDYTEYD